MIRVGDRAELEGCRVTVRFSGSLSGKEGHWVGVEWDDVLKGKHEGKLEGQQYFSCSRPGPCGSFIKLESFQKRAVHGCSLEEALRDRYSSGVRDQDVAQGQSSRQILTAGDKLLAVQLLEHHRVQDRQADLQHLERASLSGANIATVEGVGSIAPNLEELDLSSNLLSSFKSVHQLLAELQHLRLVNLSSNQLAACTSDTAHQQLQGLILNSARATWANVLISCSAFSSLRELHLCANGIATLESDMSRMLPESLEMLALEANDLTSWSDVASLSHLPNLTQLLLSSNAISVIPLDAGTGGFKTLRMLTLGSNKLQAWQSIIALDGFTSLKELRVSGNPVILAGGSGSRYEVIARVGRLQKLNGSAISAAERQDAEIRYLRRAMGDVQRSNAETQDHHSSTRIQELQERYGDLGAAASVASGNTSLGSNMLDLVLHCIASSAGRALEPQHKKVPVSMTVGKLKQLIDRLFKLSPGDQALLVKAKTDPLPLPLDGDDNLELQRFDIQGGSSIFIDDRNSEQPL
ncbi:hypothetical protein WJX74_002445 [Apatococcus lobatus]|uniref:CAP-Gly domain-containing protein n=1 Tax=Apatococcus lobatus TaxID=904363 RepID=A0AAW1RBB4_9CHLO